MNNGTNVIELLEDIDGGVFVEKISRILSSVGGAVVDNQKPGSVTIKLDFKNIGDSAQVATKSKIAYVQPTMHGKKSEEDTTDGVLQVGTGGRLSLMPEAQTEIEGLERV